jgi:2-C-methyl-D-erythritol 4-phosphate cytidylyltransferase
MVDNLRVVIAAAGAGKRMGAGINKQYLLLGSRPLLCYCLDVFQLSPLVDSIVVVTGSQEVEYCREKVIRPYNYTKVCEVVAGGPERQDSVKTGLAILGNDTDLVAIHDGARPFITTSLLESLYLAASCYGAAIPGVPVKDTIKRFDQDGFVDHTINRAEVYAVQTPQIFKYQILRQAYEKADPSTIYLH